MTCSIKILLSHISSFWRLWDVWSWCFTLVWKFALYGVPKIHRWILSSSYLSSSGRIFVFNSQCKLVYKHVIYTFLRINSIVRIQRSFRRLTRRRLALSYNTTVVLPPWQCVSYNTTVWQILSSVIVAALPEVWISAGGAAADDTS